MPGLTTGTSSFRSKGIQANLNLVPQGLLPEVDEKLKGYIFWLNSISLCCTESQARLLHSGNPWTLSEPSQINQLATKLTEPDFLLPGQLDLVNLIAEFGKHLVIKRAKGTARLYGRLACEGKSQLFLPIATMRWSKKQPTSPLDLTTPWFLPVTTLLTKLLKKNKILSLSVDSYLAQLDQTKLESLELKAYKLLPKLVEAIVKAINEALQRTYTASALVQALGTQLKHKNVFTYGRFQIANQNHFIGNLVNIFVKSKMGLELPLIANLIDHSNRIAVEKDLRVYDLEDFKNEHFTLAENLWSFDRLAEKYRAIIPQIVTEADLQTLNSYLKPIEQAALQTHLDLVAEFNQQNTGLRDLDAFFQSFITEEITEFEELNGVESELEQDHSKLLLKDILSDEELEGASYSLGEYCACEDDDEEDDDADNEADEYAVELTDEEVEQTDKELNHE